MDGESLEPEMQVLSSTECYQALASQSVGRVGVIVDQYPLIIPVNYVLDRDSVVIRTAPGTVLSHADKSLVTFQVDEFNTAKRSGWSVLLRGECRVGDLGDQGDIGEGAATVGPSSWAPGEHLLWIRIRAVGVTGRRIVPGSDREWRLTSMAYL